MAGLGNASVTPDAVGPLTAEKVLATRHITGMYKAVSYTHLDVYKRQPPAAEAEVEASPAEEEAFPAAVSPAAEAAVAAEAAGKPPCFTRKQKA